MSTVLASFVPEGADQLAELIGVQRPVGGPDGGDDGWSEAKTRLPAGSPLNKPKVLFPKIGPDIIEDHAQEHLDGKAF